jgi:integrase
VKRLADACAAVHRVYGDHVTLAAFLGLRSGELTALTVADVDLTTGLVHVRCAHSAGVIQTTKSGRFVRCRSLM